VKRGINFALLAAVLALALPGSAAAFGPLSSFGAPGAGAGELGTSRAFAIGSDGTAYVSDHAHHRISAFGPDGSFLWAAGKDVKPGGGDLCTVATSCQVGLSGGAAGELKESWGLAVGPEGDVYVADRGNLRIAVYSPAGEFLRAFGKGVNQDSGPGADPDVCTTECREGEEEEAAGYVNEPQGVEFDASGLLYIADSAYGRIDVFTRDGGFVRALGKEVQLAGSGNECTAITGCKEGVQDDSAGALEGAADVAFGPDGELVVADQGNRRVDVLAPDGQFLRAFAKGVNSESGGDPDVCELECKSGAADGSAGALNRPSGIAVDSAGRVFVSDEDNNRVSVSNVSGGFIEAFGQGVLNEQPTFQICTEASGCKQGQEAAATGAISNPTGIALDCRGAVYVSEQGTGVARVERFGEAGTAAPPCTDEPAVVPISAPAVPVLRVSNRIRFNGLRLNRRSGTAVLFVRVPGPGRAILHGRGVRRLARGARRAMRVRLPIKPKLRLKRYLKEHGKAKIRVEVTFKPDGGIPKTIEKVVVLRRKHH
jgi:DNA-binding beta-propeller fold protein YncE